MTNINPQNLQNIPYDISLFDSINNQGNINELFGLQALQNALLIFMASSQGDFIGYPSLGGWLIKHLTKPMSTSRAAQMQNDLKTGISLEFTPELQNVQVNINPDFQNRQWGISVLAYCPSLSQNFAINTTVKSLSS